MTILERKITDESVLVNVIHVPRPSIGKDLPSQATAQSTKKKARHNMLLSNLNF